MLMHMFDDGDPVLTKTTYPWVAKKRKGVPKLRWEEVVNNQQMLLKRVLTILYVGQTLQKKMVLVLEKCGDESELLKRD
jgi:hypothetical protein